VTCRCHSDRSLYGGLVDCPACGHRSFDPGVGCERRNCGHTPVSTIVYANVAVRTEVCWVCGLTFGLANIFAQRREADGQTFYCPAGCKLAYGESKIARLQRQLREQEEREARRLAQARAERDRANEEAAHAEAKARGYKGALTKAKKRSAAGVCPAPGCKRSFTDIASHVRTCHPDLATPEIEK